MAASRPTSSSSPSFPVIVEAVDASASGLSME
jgi:hypothetical protein